MKRSILTWVPFCSFYKAAAVWSVVALPSNVDEGLILLCFSSASSMGRIPVHPQPAAKVVPGSSGFLHKCYVL